MRGLWSWRRFALLVQPLFEFKKFFKFLPAWAWRGVGCLGGVLGGYLCLGEVVFWAYVFDGELFMLDFACEGGGLLVPTWDNFRE